MSKRIYKISHLFALFLLPFFAVAQPKAAQESLDEFVLAQMEKAHLPGLAACIVKGNKVVWAKGYGWANIEDALPVTTETPFMLASVSKTVTATAVMHLFENGAFALDDDINDYLSFPVNNPNFPDDVISFRMLLAHVSSIRDNWAVMLKYVVPGDSPVPLGDFLQWYLVPGGKEYYPMLNYGNWAPGTKFEYSNMSFALAGYMVEAITPLAFNEYCEEHLFAPLDMKNTGWFLKDFDASLVAMPYGYDYQSKEYVPYGHYGYPDYPDGQLRTTVLDLARFLIMHMNGGEFQGKQILKKETIEEMHTVQYPALDAYYCLGFYYDSQGGDILLGHTGGDFGVTTAMFFKPEKDIGVIVLTNGEFLFYNEYLSYLAIWDRLWREAEAY